MRPHASASSKEPRREKGPGAQVLVSDKPGCIRHLRGAAHAAHAPFQVRHFVEPLADRLRELVEVRKEE
jgi:Fe-S oxidoreductase